MPITYIYNDQDNSTIEIPYFHEYIIFNRFEEDYFMFEGIIEIKDDTSTLSKIYFVIPFDIKRVENRFDSFAMSENIALYTEGYEYNRDTNTLLFDGVSTNLKIYTLNLHHHIKNKTIVCLDFETIIEYDNNKHNRFPFRFIFKNDLIGSISIWSPEKYFSLVYGDLQDDIIYQQNIISIQKWFVQVASPERMRFNNLSISLFQKKNEIDPNIYLIYFAQFLSDSQMVKVEVAKQENKALLGREKIYFTNLFEPFK